MQTNTPDLPDHLGDESSSPARTVSRPHHPSPELGGSAAPNRQTDPQQSELIEAIDRALELREELDQLRQQTLTSAGSLAQHLSAALTAAQDLSSRIAALSQKVVDLGSQIDHVSDVARH